MITELGNARSYPWLRHAMYYLPAYVHLELRVGDLPPGYYAPRFSSAMTPFPDTDIHLPASARRLVWFVDHWSPRSERPDGMILAPSRWYHDPAYVERDLVPDRWTRLDVEA